MIEVSAAQLEEDLQTCLDGVIGAPEPLVVTLSGEEGNVVLLSQERFESWRETVHLLGNPANAAQLMRSIRQTEDGRLVGYVADAILKPLA